MKRDLRPKKKWIDEDSKELMYERGFKCGYGKALGCAISVIREAMKQDISNVERHKLLKNLHTELLAESLLRIKSYLSDDI